MKVICAPSAVLPAADASDSAFALFEQSPSAKVGSAGAAIRARLKRLELPIDARAWDLLALSIAVTAADDAVTRSSSPDGWTREIELQVALHDPAPFHAVREKIESLLQFLTVDRWTLTFTGGGTAPPPSSTKKSVAADSVGLLSGGADSLVGAIDAARSGKSRLFVSQVSAGDKKTQQEFAKRLAPTVPLLQLNHVVRPAGDAERSQRSRSFAFIAYGTLAATALTSYPTCQSIELSIPENGFISLNIPLTPLRLGSLSTRTTHPIYIAKFQTVLDALGLRVRLLNPYQFATKGEMFAGCLDQALLKELIGRSTSCGRYARNAFKHCGRCVPCLIRRAAIFAWGEADPTSYRYADLAKLDSKHRNFDDVRSALIAVLYARKHGIERWTSGAISSALFERESEFQAVAQRGLAELEALLCPGGHC